MSEFFWNPDLNVEEPKVTVVEVNITDSNRGSFKEMITWASDRLGICDHTIWGWFPDCSVSFNHFVFFFEDPKEAMFFKLTWGGL